MKFICSAALLLLSGCTPSSQPHSTFDPLLQRQSGGEATTSRVSLRSYVQPAANLSKAQQLDFWTGFSLFRDPWVIAPSSTKDRDGLGPMFNARSCIACHQAGGRAPMSEAGEHLPVALVLRLGATKQNMAEVDPHYGGQIQPRTINKTLPAESWLQLDYQIIEGQYADGQPYQLYKPSYQLTRLSQGEIAKHIGVSPRYAPNIFGMGLLDAIATEDLLKQEDISDADGDGISAKYNRTTNVVDGQTAIGRFGLKAKQPNLTQQVAAAFRDDIGITNSLFSQESCTTGQTQCQGFSLNDGREIPDKLLKRVVDFNRFIGVPPARGIDTPKVQLGQQVFYRLGCQNCHKPSYVTDKHYPIAALAGQTIWPYTDLALHDMGEGLADGVIEFDAQGNEWRTAPLWGLGLQQKIVRRSGFLHDGRARTIAQAILWHGGEAKASQQGFIALNAQDRQHLIDFLKAI